MFLLFVFVQIETFASNTSPFYTTKDGDGKSWEPLSQGPCDEDQWLVASECGLKCDQRRCGQEEVLIDGKCQDIFKESLCGGFGEAIFLNTHAEPSCQCKDGWGRNKKRERKDMVVWGRKKRDVVRSGGRCYQEFTPGFCSENKIVKYYAGNIYGCINNVCGNRSESLPH
eukprot:GFUD01118193.1.p2 GENE.GFUD01118193.1~~GFUD01118193.1.p2  ORF type:complete len:170 (+),score=28.59 GFUD01118193.1:10-519(+)